MHKQLGRITEREKDIATYLVQGYSNTEIGKQLNISRHTVKRHVTDLMHKTHARNRVHLTYIIGCYPDKEDFILPELITDKV